MVVRRLAGNVALLSVSQLTAGASVRPDFQLSDLSSFLDVFLGNFCVAVVFIMFTIVREYQG